VGVVDLENVFPNLFSLSLLVNFEARMQKKIFSRFPLENTLFLDLIEMAIGGENSSDGARDKK